MAKKKMTKAQAAAARHEVTPETEARARAKERSQLIKKSAQEAQRKANKTVGIRMILPFIIVAAIIVFAIVFTIGPGMMLGG